MIILIRKRYLLSTICVIVLGVLCCFILSQLIRQSAKSPDRVIVGGSVRYILQGSNETVSVMNQESKVNSERFQRPSKALPYPNPYSFKDFQKNDEQSPLIGKRFDNPEDLILAYYGILQEASNMIGYSGGCGSIGWSKVPYPYAYELLTKETQKEMSLNQFIDSFCGIGYTTLLKLIPAYAPSDTPAGIKYYMVEIELITGTKVNDGEGQHDGSQFAYYYGLITTEKMPDQGWKIKDIYYIPEDFLCAPMHSWFYLSDAIVQIVYGNNLKLIDRIDKTEQKNDMIYIYASGKEKSYRFDFVRISNGYDILVHEYILDNGSWKETNLLSDKWKNMKLTVESSIATSLQETN
ncbi:hypothetical protein [Clostridium sp. C105KSO13]|uniref:hypothetical protein n=1 Tax=Clostridium sp. C105KSO13 TaxID=1776045 RepID=UPI0007407403|nr:hypothetical protein [Clostridium sp. C105KSO13]CUX44523.1 hypothetical protein BN3456_02411 [Clostridium sp. C105KSO13]